MKTVLFLTLALSLPIFTQVSAGVVEKDFASLKNQAFNSKLDYKARWKALLALVDSAPSKAIPELRKASKSADWFMRDAALRGMAKVDPNEAKQMARSLLKDKALIVRTTAVEYIKKLNDSDSESLLWVELNNPQNFRGQQSLWIRRHIVEALSEFKTKGNEARFVELLADADQTLHVPALKALESLQGAKYDRNVASVDEKKAFWKKWIRSASNTD